MAKNTRHTNVSLTDLPDQGESYEFTRKSGELNDALKDLIQNKEYDIQIQLRPLGDVFEISGQIQTHIVVPCSRCGRETDHAIHDQFTELIMIESPRPRKGTASSHEGHSDGPYCNYVQSPIFNLADFCHEHIAAAEPFIVECQRADCIETLKQATQRASAPEEERSNPFQELKKILKN